MPSLRKGDHNQHGNYNYVSIDSMFETVAKIAFEEGITWAVRQTDFMIDASIGKGVFVGTYHFDLNHILGAECKDFFIDTVPHPIQGAQTAGSAMSYAMKLFLRNTFGVVTGEADADATDSRELDAQSQRLGTIQVAEPARRPPELRVIEGSSTAAIATGTVRDADWCQTFQVLIAGSIDLAKTEDELIGFWRDNHPGLEDLSLSNRDLYDQVVALFKEKKKELRNG